MDNQFDTNYEDEILVSLKNLIVLINKPGTEGRKFPITDKTSKMLDYLHTLNHHQSKMAEKVERYESIRKIKIWLEDSPIDTYMDENQIDMIDFSKQSTKHIKEFLDCLIEFERDYEYLDRTFLQLSNGEDI